MPLHVLSSCKRCQDDRPCNAAKRERDEFSRDDAARDAEDRWPNRYSPPPSGPAGSYRATGPLSVNGYRMTSNGVLLEDPARGWDD